MTHYDPKDHTLLERVEALEHLCNGLNAANDKHERSLSRLQNSCVGWMDRLTKRMDTASGDMKLLDNDVAITIRSMVDLSNRIGVLERKEAARSTYTPGPGQ